MKSWSLATRKSWATKDRKKRQERNRKQQLLKPEKQPTSPLAAYEFVDSSSEDTNDILKELFLDLTPLPTDQALTDFYCSEEAEALVDNMVAHIPLKIIKFDCMEFLDSPSLTVNEIFDTTPSEPADQLLNDFDLTLFLFLRSSVVHYAGQQNARTRSCWHTYVAEIYLNIISLCFTFSNPFDNVFLFVNLCLSKYYFTVFHICQPIWQHFSLGNLLSRWTHPHRLVGLQNSGQFLLSISFMRLVLHCQTISCSLPKVRWIMIS